MFWFILLILLFILFFVCPIVFVIAAVIKIFFAGVACGVFVTLILWWICSDRKSKDKSKENN